MTKYLFVNNDYVEAREGLSRIVHPLRQHPSNPLIVQDRPWECHVDCRWYPSVCMWSNSILRDPETGKFRIWYTGYADKDDQGRAARWKLDHKGDHSHHG